MSQKVTKRGKTKEASVETANKENVKVEKVNNKSNGNVTVKKNTKTKKTETVVEEKKITKKNEKETNNEIGGEKDTDLSKNGAKCSNEKNRKDLKLNIEETNKKQPTPLSEKDQLEPNSEHDLTELDTPLIEPEEKSKTNDAGDSLAKILDNLVIDENTDFVRRSVRRTASELVREETEKINCQLRKDNDDNLGIEVKMFPEKGRGVVTTRDRVKGEFVVEYAGDIINMEEAGSREEEYSRDKTKGCYMYYFKHQDVQYCVDGTAETGRMGRLLNHSCVAPNCFTKVVSLDGKPRLILLAKQDIAEGTELIYDYGDRDKATIKAHPWLAL